MLKPIDIHNKEFNRSFRGYNEDEIDEFLDEVVDDYETLYKENETLKQTLENERIELQKLRKLEQSLQETLLLAQTTADDIIKKAQEDSKNLLLKAENDSNNMRLHADNYASDLRSKIDKEAKEKQEALANEFQEKSLVYEDLLEKQRDFVEKMKSLFQTELNLLNSEGVENLFKSRDIKDILLKETKNFNATKANSLNEENEPIGTEQVEVSEDTLVMEPITDSNK